MPKSSIKGFRAPFLSLTADTFQILHDQGFTYDSSLTSSNPLNADDTDAWWPYTLDSGLANSCLTVEGICQGEPQLPGLWEIPMYSFFEDDRAVSVMDPYLGSDTDRILDLLKRNFDQVSPTQGHDILLHSEVGSTNSIITETDSLLVFTPIPLNSCPTTPDWKRTLLRVANTYPLA